MYSAGKFATEVSNIPQSLPISLFDLSPQLDLNAMRTFKLDPNSSFKELAIERSERHLPIEKYLL